jgi:hypothetical protein
VVVPTSLSGEERQLYEQLRGLPPPPHGRKWRHHRRGR